MLLSVLFDEGGEIVCAAPACDQLPIGDSYWREVCGLEMANQDIGEVAVVEVADENLVRALVGLHTDTERIDQIRRAFKLYEDQAMGNAARSRAA